MTYYHHLLLATFSFGLCFMAWGLISGLAPLFSQLLSLSTSQTATLIAVPVLMGALARIPLGILTDRFGGRLVFTILFLITAAASAVIPLLMTWPAILVGAFVVGLAGSSFAVGVGYVSRWAPPGSQGSMLGLYGLGNIGQSLAVFVSPFVAKFFGWQNVFYGTAGLLILWAIIFGIFARDAERQSSSKLNLSDMKEVFLTKRLSWLLSLFYFLTFGGFLFIAMYLPTLLRDQFSLTSVESGFRTAMFVCVATFCRPLGGWLADRYGSARVFSSVLLGITLSFPLMALPYDIPFSIGTLGCALFLGAGNGVVFNMVPEIFPRQVATVSGLVGALGGLGGFFLPISIGLSKQYLGVTWPCFAVMTVLSLVLLLANHRVFIRQKT